MLEIKCPYCGKRSQNEFSYGGDANAKRPKLGIEVSDLDIVPCILNNYSITIPDYMRPKSLITV